MVWRKRKTGCGWACWTPVVQEGPAKPEPENKQAEVEKTEVKTEEAPVQQPQVEEKQEPKQPEIKAEELKPEPMEEEKKQQSVQENKEDEVFKIRPTEFKSKINVVGQIDLAALNQSTRPKKKSKEDWWFDRVFGASQCWCWRDIDTNEGRWIFPFAGRDIQNCHDALSNKRNGSCRKEKFCREPG